LGNDFEHVVYEFTCRNIRRRATSRVRAVSLIRMSGFAPEWRSCSSVSYSGTMRRKLAVAMIVSSLVGVWTACGDDGSTFTDGNGEDGGGPGPGPLGPGVDGGGTPTVPDGSLGTCDAGCAQGAHCKYGVCIPDLGTCNTNDDCPGDSYCDTDKTCVPY